MTCRELLASFLVLFALALPCAKATEGAEKVCDQGKCYLRVNVLQGESYCALLKLPVGGNGRLAKTTLSRAEIYLSSRFNQEKCEDSKYFYVTEAEVEAVSSALQVLHKALRSDTALFGATSVKENTLQCLLKGSGVRVDEGSYYHIGKDPELVVLTLGGCDLLVEARLLVREFGRRGSIRLSYKVPVVEIRN